MTHPLVEELFAHARAHHPRSVRGLEEARAVAPERFDEMTGRMLQWAAAALGADALATTMGAFVRFSESVIFAQARYEETDAYENRSYDEVRRALYSQRDPMDDYLWGVYLTNTLWAHHMDLSLFFVDRFLPKVAADAHVVELAPGHGGWGLLALHSLPHATLEGFDISPSSIHIASLLAHAADLNGRATYEERDALTMSEGKGGHAQACICNFLVEHLEAPDRLLHSIAHVLEVGGHAFFSGALTAAQIDHIYEFRMESELVRLAEAAGLRLLEARSVGPRRVLRGAKYLPRSMSMILQKRRTPTF